MIIREERIGGQRLILGDSSKIASEIQYDTICSDPPYGMSFQSNHRNDKHSRILNDGDVNFLQWCANLPALHSKYIWMRWDNIYDIPKPKSLITWVKNNWSMGDLSHEHGRQTEVCAFYDGPEHKWGSGRPSDVINCARTGNNYHPTEKPVALMIDVVRWTVGHVFDPFMGSGTTLVACQRLGRNGTGIELDPDYFNTACERVQKAVDQPDLFIDPPAPQPVQESLL